MLVIRITAGVSNRGFRCVARHTRMPVHRRVIVLAHLARSGHSRSRCALCFVTAMTHGLHRPDRRKAVQDEAQGKQQTEDGGRHGAPRLLPGAKSFKSQRTCTGLSRATG